MDVEFRGPLRLNQRAVEETIPPGIPGAFALGHQRPHDAAACISFVGRADADLRTSLLRHVGSHYSVCFWRPAHSAVEAYQHQYKLWREMGGPDGYLRSGGPPLPPEYPPEPAADEEIFAS